MKRLIAVLLCMLLLIPACGVTGFAAAQLPAAAPAEKAAMTATGAGNGFNYTGEDVLDVPQIRVITEDGNGIALQKDDGYVNASITITDVDGSVLADSCTFKVRGNSTAMTHVPKKPFTFKFSKKKDVLGMGKGKKWALLANAFDPTLLRNYMSFELARELGLSYTSEQKIVELWVDNSYRGCYTLYEPVQEGKDRVDIDIESNAGKKDFMLEYEASRLEDDVTYIMINGLRFAVSEPDEPDEEQVAYITAVMNDIVNTLKSGTREEIGQKIDIPSFVRFYLLNEYLKTMDFDMSSVFYYYKDGVLYAGPPWDYDLATGNTNDQLNSARAKATHRTDGILQNKNIYKYICDQSWFYALVKEAYEAHYDYIENISADGGLLDALRAQYADVFARNFTVWPENHWLLNYQMQPMKTYEENYKYLKNWLRERNEWLTQEWELFTYSYKRGDADGDGAVDAADAVVIQRVLARMIQDEDGRVALRSALGGDHLDITDATWLQRYLAKMDTPYDFEEILKINTRACLINRSDLYHFNKIAIEAT